MARSKRQALRPRAGAGSVPVHAGWSEADKSRFLDVLQTTSNVSEAVRSIGKTSAGAYDLKNRDAQFARRWMQALEHGYCELEMLLLRHALNGSERIETVEGEGSKDGDANEFRRTKTIHSYPYGMAIRLVMAHRKSVEEFRLAQGIDRPGSDEVRDEIYARLALARKRGGGSES